MAEKNSPIKKNKLNGVFGRITNLGDLILGSDRSLTVISILTAIVLWVLISVDQVPVIEREFKEVPIVIDLDGSKAQENSLEAVSISDEICSVKIRGQRAEIGSLKPTDLVAYVNADNAKDAKEYNLTMDVKASNGKEFSVVNMEPATVSVRFDRIISKELTIEPEITGMRAASGYVVGDVDIFPKTITVTGPQETIDDITKATAKLDLGHELSSTYDGSTSDILLYKGEDVLSDSSSLKFDKDKFMINIPVYFKHTLPLSVKIANAPSSLDIDFFKNMLVYSTKELIIASTDETIKERESLEIGTLNIREVNTGSSFDFPTETFLPADCKDISNVNSIKVTCPNAGLAMQPFTIMGKDIQFINSPEGFEFSSLASGLTFYLVGDENQVSRLINEDITAQVDLINFNKVEGDFQTTVDLIIPPAYDKVWITGAVPRIYVNAAIITEITTAPVDEPSEDT